MSENTQRGQKYARTLNTKGKSLRRNLLSFLQSFLDKDFHYFQNTLTNSLIICWNKIILLHFSFSTFSTNCREKKLSQLLYFSTTEININF